MQSEQDIKRKNLLRTVINLSMANNKANMVNATGTSFEILEALADMEGARVSEIASTLEIPKSTTHNHLQTLVDKEYVVQEDGKYDIGLRFLRLGEYSRTRNRLFSIARPEIESLATETDELVNLNVEEYGRGVFLYRAKGSDAVHMDTYAGKRVYLHTTAFGKSILANISEKRVENIIEKHGLPEVTNKTITDPDELKSELGDISECGYALEREERLKGLCCVAAPITVDETVVGSVSVSGPESRMQGERFTEELPNLIQETTNVIEVNLRYGSG